VNAVDELTAIQEMAAENPGAAGRRMVLALMRGDADSYKAGYTAQNALMAAGDYLHLDGDVIVKALTPDRDGDEFVAFLHYLADELDAGVKDVIYAVEKPGKYWEQYADYLVSQEPNAAPARTLLGAMG
jgi:hypothetical protein